MIKKDYDAIVIGSGPNGLAAAITMQREGLSVLLIEGKSTIGGGLRTKQLTMEGFHHDVCSAVHPLAAESPFFKSLPLQKYGLEYIYPLIAAAHPFDDGTAAVLSSSMQETIFSLDDDANDYLKLLEPLIHIWDDISVDALGPLSFPKHPLKMASFGLKALKSITSLTSKFPGYKAKSLLAGMAAHSIQPLTNRATSAIALVLSIVGHKKGWPIPKSGSWKIADALASYFISLGGKIETNTYISNLTQLPSHRALLFDTTPKQLLDIAGHKFSSIYKWQLEKYRYGMGVYKIDWALSEAIPFIAASCKKAGTIHLGNTSEEIEASEYEASKGLHSKNPFVLLAQPSLFDSSRSPLQRHVAWAYCHVPNGSQVDMTEAIENQIERFAPGFKDIILAKHTFNTSNLEDYNPNYIGGDINGGIIDIRQLFTRPALRWSPYKTSLDGMYICSSSTPPGGGVHGMCGYYSAKKALSDVFNIKLAGL